MSRRHVLDGRGPSTLFIGGGTPSSLTAGQLAKLLSFLQYPENGEATCELNPDSATREKLVLLREHGINRCSFGVQTFSKQGLELLQRRHDADTARKAVEEALDVGFSSISIDLIMGWPGQQPADLLSDLRIAVDLGVTHLSCYQLILEEESRCFEEYQALLPDDADDAEGILWSTAERYLAASGFEHYETSNFARPGHQCRHNADIWRGGEYLGIGLSAHSHLAGIRSANTCDLALYLQENGDPERIRVFSEQLDGEAKARECAVFWFRLFEGIDLTAFKRRTGWDLLELYPKEIPDLLPRGIMENVDRPEGKFIRVAAHYQPVLDSILVDLV